MRDNHQKLLFMCYDRRCYEQLAISGYEINAFFWNMVHSLNRMESKTFGCFFLSWTIYFEWSKPFISHNYCCRCCCFLFEYVPRQKCMPFICCVRMTHAQCEEIYKENDDKKVLARAKNKLLNPSDVHVMCMSEYWEAVSFATRMPMQRYIARNNGDETPIFKYFTSFLDCYLCHTPIIFIDKKIVYAVVAHIRQFSYAIHNFRFCFCFVSLKIDRYLLFVTSADISDPFAFRKFD